MRPLAEFDTSESIDNRTFYTVVTAFDTISRANNLLQEESPFQYRLLNELAWAFSRCSADSGEHDLRGKELINVGVEFDQARDILQFEYSSLDGVNYLITSERLDKACIIRIIDRTNNQPKYTIRSKTFGLSSSLLDDLLHRMEIFKYDPNGRPDFLGYMDYFENYAPDESEEIDFLAVIRSSDSGFDILLAQELLNDGRTDFLYSHDYFERLARCKADYMLPVLFQIYQEWLGQEPALIEYIRGVLNNIETEDLLNFIAEVMNYSPQYYGHYQQLYIGFLDAMGKSLDLRGVSPIGDCVKFLRGRGFSLGQQVSFEMQKPLESRDSWPPFCYN